MRIEIPDAECPKCGTWLRRGAGRYAFEGLTKPLHVYRGYWCDICKAWYESVDGGPLKELDK